MIEILDDYSLIITRVADAIDKDGTPYLKCSGKHCYKRKKKNGEATFNAYDFFSTVKVYGDEVMLGELKNRLWSDKSENPSVKIISYQSELYTPYLSGRILTVLEVQWFDFAKNKMGIKKIMKDLIKKENKSES